jgi:hypothetical protein
VVNYILYQIFIWLQLKLIERKGKVIMGKIGIIASIIILPVVLCFTASATDISGVPSPVGDTTITMSAETTCVGIVFADTYYTNRWIDANDGDSGAQQVGTVTIVLPPDDTAGTKAEVPVIAPASDLGGPGRASVLGAGDTASEISYEEEVNAIHGTTQYVKKLGTDTEKAPNLDVDTNITFVADPAGGRLVSNEKVGLQVVTNGFDNPSETPSEYDVSSLCPWLQDPGPAADEIPASNEAVAMGSDMNVSIVQANTAATVGATGSERNVSYDVVAAGPEVTGGYGVGIISAGMEVEVQKGADKVGWKPSEPVYVGPENPTAEQLSDPNNYEVPATLTAPSLLEYQAYQDSLTSSGVWTFSKEMEYLSEIQ